MMQIIAWIAAACCLFGGLSVLLMKSPPEKRGRARLAGLVLLAFVPLNLLLALRAR